MRNTKYVIGSFHQTETNKRQTTILFTKQAASFLRGRNVACKGRTGGGQKLTFDLQPMGWTGFIRWTWVKPWRTREQRPQESGSWGGGKVAHWPGPAAADSLTETTPGASSKRMDVWMDGRLWKSMYESRENKAFKDGRIQQRLLEARRITEANVWQRNIRARKFLTSFRRSMSLR